jgi:hypothetical protein
LFGVDRPLNDLEWVLAARLLSQTPFRLLERLLIRLRHETNQPSFVTANVLFDVTPSVDAPRGAIGIGSDEEGVARFGWSASACHNGVTDPAATEPEAVGRAR